MAKLDVKALDELIKEVLSEVQGTIHVGKKQNNQLKSNDTARDFAAFDGQNYTYGSGQAWKNLYNAGGDKFTLDQNDIDAIIYKDASNPAYKLVRALAANKDDTNIDTDAKELRNKVYQALVDARNTVSDEAIKKKITQYLTAINPGLSIDDRGDLRPFGRVTTPVSQVSGDLIDDQGDFKPINTIKAQIDSSTVAIFNGIPGNTFLAKFAAIEKFAKDVEAGDAPSSQDVKATFQAANLGLVLNEFGNMSKEYDATSAGTQFEKFLALLTSGQVVGGESGAVDVTSAIGASPERILYSAKLYASSDFKQALGKGKPEGIEGIVRTKGEPLYYLFGFKSPDSIAGKAGAGLGTGEAQKYKYIYVFILKLTWDDSEQKYMCQAINPDGNLYGPELPLKEEGKQLKFQPYFKGKDTSQYYAYEIPVVDKARIADLTNGVAQYLTDQLLKKDANNAYENPLLANIVNVFKRLQNMERNTQEYNAEKAGGSQDASEYVTAISTDYIKLKTEYEDIFTKGEGSTQTISESKFAQLDKLILEVLKNNS